MENPALLSRTIIDMHDGNVLVTEKWDYTHPQCPFAVSDRNPYAGQLQRGVLQKIEPKEQHL